MFEKYKKIKYPDFQAMTVINAQIIGIHHGSVYSIQIQNQDQVLIYPNYFQVQTNTR